MGQVRTSTRLWNKQQAAGQVRRSSKLTHVESGTDMKKPDPSGPQVVGHANTSRNTK